MNSSRHPLTRPLVFVCLAALAVTGALAQTPATFEVYPAPNGLGTNSGEPSVGVNWNSDRVMFIAGLETLRVDLDECTSPPEDNWTDVSADNTTITTLDPILFTDSVTGRTFASQLAAKCSNMSYTDDDGDSWMVSQGCGINAGVDHQTVGGGPYNPAAIPPPPPPTPPDFYPHAVYYCSQDVAVAQCARSDNGGLTFGPAVPMYNVGDCGGLHGAIHVDSAGTVYVPNKNCGALPLMTGGRNAVAVSEDNGVTWNVRQLPVNQGGNWDPSVWAATQPGSGANMTGVGTLYMGFIRTAPNLNRTMWAGVSRDNGVTWTDIQNIGLGVGPNGNDLLNGAFPVTIAGDGDRAAIGFIGAEQGGDGAGDNPNTGHIWHAYVAMTYDGGQTWETMNVTPGDPVQRGQVCDNGPNCNAARNLLDFNDMAIDREGRAVFALADGCIGDCVTGGGTSAAELATIIRQVSGRRLFSAFDTLDAPGSPRLAASIDENDPALVHLTWQAPDDHGSAITGYDLYKRIDDGMSSATLIASLGAGDRSYDDMIDPAGDKVFYSITASNAIGTSEVCREVSPQGDESPCLAPGITILEDAIGDWTAAGPDARDDYDIEKLSINERPDLGPGKIEFILKMVSMADPLPRSTYPVQFKVGGADRMVRMHLDATGTAFFTHATGTDTSPTTNPGLPADPASNFTADGSIRIVVDRSDIGVGVGTGIDQFLVRVRREAVGVSPTPDNMPSGLAPGGSYTVFGSENCVLGDPPIAVDDFATTHEDAPVVIDVIANDVSFNGALTVVSVTDPANGSTVNNGDGTVTFSPDPGFTSPPDATFDYTIEDAAGLPDVGTVTVTVEPDVVRPPHCEVPGVLVADDPLGDTNAIIDATDDPSLDIDSVHLAEPDLGAGAEKLVATIQVEDFSLPHPSAAWRVFWTSPGGTQQYFVSLENCDATVGIQCSYGTFDGTLFSSQGQPEGCEFLPDGTINITVDKSLVGISDTTNVGDDLTDVNGRTQVFIGALCTGLLGQADNAGPANYTLQGNESCRPGDIEAVPDFAETDENTSVVIDVLANDIGDGISVLNTTIPANGSVANNGSDVTYTPNTGFDGVDVFEYTITNGSQTSSAEVTVTVNDTVNNAPTADDQAVATDEDTAVAITLTASDPENDPLTYSVTSGPSHGSLSGTAPNLTYTPDPDYNGPDSFQFVANDGTQDSNTATVSITVNPVNDAPLAMDDSYSTEEETTLNVAAPGVLGNDTDVDGPALSASLETPPANGMAAVNADGSFTYTPDAGFCDAVDTFTYRASDGDLADTATVSIQVACTGGNRAPTADDQAVETDEDTPVGITLTASDPDGDSLTYNVTSPPANGSLSGTAPNLTYTPNPDSNGADSFTFEACDAELCDSGLVSITVRPVNDAPTANDDFYSTTEDTTLTIPAPGVLANDSDPDGNPLGAFLETGPSNGTLTLASDGSFSYTPNPGFCGASDSFTYRASDGAAQSAPATASILVDCIVEPPVCDGDDDDFDSDGVRDDVDSDDDNDGIPDDADSDDDNDGIPDDADSDDDNDCIDDDIDSDGSQEDVQFSPRVALVDEIVGSTVEVGPTTTLVMAIADSAEAELLELRIYDPSGQLVGVSTPGPGRATATAVPVVQGIYTVVIDNLHSTRMIETDLTTVERLLW